MIDEVGRRISLWRCPCGVMLGLVLNGRLYLPAGKRVHEVETFDLYVPCDACGRVVLWTHKKP